MSTRPRKPSHAESRRFVQVATHPSLGVETTSGRAWVGVDQQVGHGSADALYALTPQQYADALVDSSVIRTFMAECWRGDHPDLRLHEPGGGRWTPEHWVPRRTRMFPASVEGEIWHHVDALGEPVGSERGRVSQELAAGTASAEADDDGVAHRLHLPLVGDGAHPRPHALVAGLGPGSTRAQVRAVLGEPLPGDPEAFGLAGDVLRMTFGAGDDGAGDDGAGGGLTALTLERPVAPPAPAGLVRTALLALGAPEAGPAYRAVTALADGRPRRWAVSTGFHRRLVTFDDGLEIQVEDGVVLSVRLPLRARDAVASDRASALLPGSTRPPTREDVERTLGAPVASRGRFDLHRFAEGDVLVEHTSGDPDSSPSELTAIRAGTGVSHRIHRWRSGELFLFLDALGRPAADPLVEHVRGLPGVRVLLRGDVVDGVEIGGSGHTGERYAAFVDGMPPEPTREQLRLGRPHDTGDHDDLRYLDQGCLHVHAADGTRISRITVSREAPRGIELRRWRRPGEA